MSDEQRLAEAIDAAWNWELSRSPETATLLGYKGYDDRWTDLAPEAHDAAVADQRNLLDTLAGIDRAALSEPAALNLALLERQTRLAVDGARFHEEQRSLSQLDGVHQDAAMYLEAQQKDTVEQITAVIERLRRLPAMIDQSIAQMRLGMAAGNTPPQICLRDVPQQIRNQLVSDPMASPLLVGLDAPHVADHLRDAATRAFTSAIAPAYERLHSFVVDEYLSSCRQTLGARDLPDGEALYAHCIVTHTTTDLTAAEIHQIGLDEVARISAEMTAVARRAGFDGIESYSKHLQTDPAQRHVVAEELLENYRAIGRHIDAELPRLFGRLPSLPYEIVAVPPYAEESQTAAYYLQGSFTDGRPGQFFANTYDLPARFIWEAEALTLHEAVPGHHLQIALAQELTDLPDFRRHSWFTAYGEGWGLYAESLGEELGLYRDPASKFGALTGEMWRAVRLVIDTGLHAFGWGRDQAIAYFQQATGRDDHDIVVEVDRYIVWPGQALGYKIGELKFKELRQRVTAAMGADFDVRSFHDEVLRHGCLPLDVLERKVVAAFDLR